MTTNDQASEPGPEHPETPPEPTTTVQQPSVRVSGVGEHIGPYRILDLLGTGGMGVVYLAEQRSPVHRRVALKVIKPQRDSADVLARFEAERQALALLNHPNIARILDTGTTEDIQPFFAMEFVQGTPITKYCDDNRLTIRDRLKLFCDVCRGVQHAHQKGIIHRDLKPSNILVATVDGQPVPKVIDFGLAKMQERPRAAGDPSLYTAIGQILGTFRYMSPEQASLDAVDIDTRVDIYALGVILYELLTGSTPLDSESLKQQAVLDVLQMIRDQEPVRPSKKMAAVDADSLSSITSLRQTDSRQIQRALTDDLDWIVIKTLEKDRTRRYESASGLAADIERHLNDEPIEAHPPSASYRISRFVKRNRGLVAVSAFSAGLILLALMITSGALYLALDQRNAAMLATLAAMESEREARASEAELKESLDSIENLASSQANLMRVLLTATYRNSARDRLPDSAAPNEVAALAGEIESSMKQLFSESDISLRRQGVGALFDFDPVVAQVIQRYDTDGKLMGQMKNVSLLASNLNNRSLKDLIELNGQLVLAVLDYEFVEAMGSQLRESFEELEKQLR